MLSYNSDKIVTKGVGRLAQSDATNLQKSFGDLSRLTKQFCQHGFKPFGTKKKEKKRGSKKKKTGEGSKKKKIKRGSKKRKTERVCKS